MGREVGGWVGTGVMGKGVRGTVGWVRGSGGMGSWGCPVAMDWGVVGWGKARVGRVAVAMGVRGTGGMGGVREREAKAKGEKGLGEMAKGGRGSEGKGREETGWVVMVAAGREGVTEAGLRERWYFRVVSNECYSACHRPYFTQKDQKQGLKVLHTNHV